MAKRAAATGRDHASAWPLPVKQTGRLRAKAGVNPRDLIERLLNGTTRKRGEIRRAVETARGKTDRVLEISAGGRCGTVARVISEGLEACALRFTH